MCSDQPTTSTPNGGRQESTLEEGTKPGAAKIHIPEVDIIYHNMNVASDFRTMRSGSDGPIEEVVIQIAKHLTNQCYNVISINASCRSCVVVLSTELSREELGQRGFPWPGWEDRMKRPLQ